MKRPWPMRHVGLRVWSVVLAVMLWMLVAGQETVERGLRIPLELQQFPPGLELQGDPPSLIDVRVRGESGALGRVAPGDIVAVLDLRTARPGRRLYTLTQEQVRAPFGIRVMQVTPPSLVLTFENSATRIIPVVPSVEGDPAPGFLVGPVTANPGTVEVIGPESAVKRATEAITESVSVTGARENVTDMVTVGFQDPMLRLRTVTTVSVTVGILPAPAERTLRGRPVRLRGPGAAVQAQALPAAADITIRGAYQTLDRLDVDAVVPFVDLSGLGVGEYSLAVRVDAPQGVGVTSVQPANVQVRISSVKP